MTEKNKITEDDFLHPITKLKAIAALFGDRSGALNLIEGESFGVKWILDDIAKDFQSIYDRWLES